MRLIDLLYFLAYGTFQAVAIKNLCPKRYNKKIIGFLLMCMCIWIYIAYHFGWGGTFGGFFVTALIVPTLIITMILTVYHRKLSGSLFGLGAICQIIYIASDAFSLAASRMIGTSFQPWIYRIIIPVLGFVLSYALYFFMSGLKSLPQRDGKIIILFSVNVLTAILIFVVYFSLLQYNFIRDRWLFLISLAIMSLFSFSCALCMVLYSRYVKEKQDAVQKEEELKHLMTYATTIEETYDKMIELKHDYKNMLFAMRDDEALQKKLEGLLAETFSIVEKDSISEGLASIGNIPVKSLMAAKLISFSNQSVKVSFKVLGGKIDRLYVDDFDAVRMLGILLDNAFEEASETEDRSINIIAVHGKEKVDFFIENSCRDNLPEIQEFFTKGFSSKGEARGIGLSNFREIIRKYPFCSFSMKQKESNVFSVELSLSGGAFKN